ATRAGLSRRTPRSRYAEAVRSWGWSERKRETGPSQRRGAMIRRGQSKVKSDRKLYDPGLARRNHLTELAVYLRSGGGIEHGVVVHSLELRMVEGVVQLGAELQGPAFALQRKSLHERDVPVILSRSADGVYGSVAGIDSGPVGQVGHDKRSRIKPAIEGSIPVRKLGPCDDVRPYSVTPAGEIDALHGAKANRLRQSTGHRGYTRNLPVVEYAADQQFRPGTSHKFTGLWKVPNVVHDEHMGLVEVGGAIRPYPPR